MNTLKTLLVGFATLSLCGAVEARTPPTLSQTALASGVIQTTLTNASNGASGVSYVLPGYAAAGSYSNPTAGVTAGGAVGANGGAGYATGPNGGHVAAAAGPYGAAVSVKGPKGQALTVAGFYGGIPLVVYTPKSK